MAAVAARELADGEVVFVGIGLPNLACNLARATHAPRLVLIYESGAVGAVPERLPVSIGDPALVTGSLMVCGMADVFQCILQNGRIEVGFLGGAQVDRYGNINTTVIGPYARPKVRLPGCQQCGRLGRATREGHFQYVRFSVDLEDVLLQVIEIDDRLHLVRPDPAARCIADRHWSSRGAAQCAH